MDSLTHIVLGMIEGELIAGKKLGKKAMLWGAIANSLPDIDVIPSMFVSVDNSLLMHRGFTHSILFAILISILAAFYFRRKNHALEFSGWLLLWGCGMFSHILIDSFTTYGTGWFEPFSHYRVSFNTIFVADPFFTLSLLIGAIALLIKKRFSTRRTTWALIGLIPAMIYLCYTFYNKAKIDTVTLANFKSHGIAANRYMTTPSPLNNFLWYILAQDNNGFYTGYYSVFDKTDSIHFSFTPAQHELANQYADDAKVQRLIRFSQGYYCLTTDTIGKISLHDLRFGLTDLFTDKKDFVFTYDLKSNADGMMIQRGRMKAISSDAFKKLIERIKGI
ncbi:MAG: metal-dependent hydrolase [Bacteroidota bacterium]